jgi:hypothetical protein
MINQWGMGDRLDLVALETHRTVILRNALASSMPSALCRPKIRVIAAVEEKIGECLACAKKALEKLETAVGEGWWSVRVAPPSLADVCAVAIVLSYSSFEFRPAA